MSGTRRSGRLLARFEEVAGDDGGEDAPNPAGVRGRGRRGHVPRGGLRRGLAGRGGRGGRVGGRGAAHDNEGAQEQELEHEQGLQPEGGAGQAQGHEVPPPPPPPNLADVMAVQTQLMQTITQLLAQNNNNNHRG
jgi:hypothetical protein